MELRALDAKVLKQGQETRDCGQRHADEKYRTRAEPDVTPRDEAGDREVRREDAVDEHALEQDERRGGEQRAEKAGDRALEQERQLDGEAGGADQLHDAGLPPPAERRDPDGVDD